MRPSKTNRICYRIACVPFMLLFIFLLHSLEVPNPLATLLIPIAVFAAADGYVGGTLSGACAVGYSFYVYSSAQQIGVYTITDAQRIFTITLAIVAMVFVVGRFKALTESTIQAHKELLKELDHKNQELDQAVEEAERANEAKSEFLSRVSHDIRTPINVILGSTELAFDSVEDPVAIKEYLNNTKITGNFLLALVNDVLDISKIESGELNFNPERYCYEDFVNRIRTMLEPLCDEKKITLVTDLESTLPPVHVAHIRLEQVFFNLLSNAVKFTPEHGTVTFSVVKLKEYEDTITCEFSVEDTGVGMSDEFQKIMFAPFAQAATRSDIKGTGLGLSIVKNVIDGLGGTIDVASFQGKGTRIIVVLTLPLSKEDARSIEPDELLDWSKLKGKRVLVAEDHPLNMAIIQRILEKQEIEVIPVEDGVQAVEAFEYAVIGHFDVVLLDVRMPHMDGFEAAQTIRELDRPDAKTIPIAAMTADVFEKEKSKSVKCGMNSYLTKPIDPPELYDTLVKMLNEQTSSVIV